jgi:diphthine-ammonia ligase
MDVSWWTSAAAYLPRGASAEAAVRAGKVWEIMHARDEDEGTEDQDSEVRDLWEEKHYTGMDFRGGNLAQRKLPDWEVVAGREKVIPPFWAVEVEELPRGSGIEWHAHLGVVAGPVKVFTPYFQFGGLDRY